MFQNAAAVTFVSFAAFVVAYYTYGRFLSRRVFKLDDSQPTPAHELEDGVDFVPTKPQVLFGHHFASIAGLGPILGPAIAVIWGWVPAVLWVVFGSIFIGAVHDFGALFLSLRFDGRSVGDVCRNVIHPRARILALFIIFFLLAIVLGAFVNAVTGLFVNFNPDAIIPSFGLIFVAMVMGFCVYRLNVGLGRATVLGLVAFAVLIVTGVNYPITTYEWFTSSETQATIELARGAEASGDRPGFEAPYGAAGALRYFNANGQQEVVQDIEESLQGTKLTWISALLFYAFVASVLPVWLLLQPRDYINSFQLYFALGALFLGLIIASLVGAPESHISAVMFRPEVPLEPLFGGQTLDDVGRAPSWFPLLFVTIACGAVSGFHCLVSSGTTVRQLDRESDALPIGYGGMLTEGALAVLVIMACVAGLGVGAWQGSGEYASWSGIKGGGLSVQLSAVVRGGAAFLAHVGIPLSLGRAFLAVTIVAFAMTTLDTATRILRFNIEEICRSVHLDILANRYIASLLAVAAIAFFALVPAGKSLWILFGTTNQLLAGLALLTVSVFMHKLKRPVYYTAIPMAIMLILSIWVLVGQIRTFVEGENWSLVVVSSAILVMSLWLVFEALLSFRKKG